MSQALASGRELIARSRLSNLASLNGAVVAAGTAVLVGGAAAAAGGYYPTSWGWTALALFWVVGIVLLVRRTISIGRFELLFLAGLTLFGGWMWLSTAWSEAAPGSVLEGQHVLVYVGAAAAAVLLVRPRLVPHLLGGLLVAITFVSIYGLGTRLFPNRIGSFDPIAGYRLEEPLGYWNALGIFAAIGALLALGFAARGRRWITRALAAAAVAILLPTVYFTFSRGSWLALGFGILVAVVFDARRLQLITAFSAAALAPAVSVWVASRSDALTHTTASIGAAIHDGERFALVILGAAAVSAVSIAALAAAERWIPVPKGVRVAYAVVLVAAALAAAGVAVERYGSPTTIARKAYDRFTAAAPKQTPNLNERLFNISSNGRVELWQAAWADYRDHPWVGSGAGSYEHEWYRRRDIDLVVRDAHNLYLEQLAELGPLGLGLLALTLAVPLVAAGWVRRTALGVTALSAYAAFLVHAAADWDWEMTAVTLAGLCCAVALLALARDERHEGALRPAVRFGGAGTAAALAVLAFVGLVGNLADAASGDAAARGDWRKAVAEAERASDWAPWSSHALRRLGEAEAGRGNVGAAASAFRRAVAKDPNDWELWQDLYRATQGAESRAAFRRTYELNPRGVR